MGAQALGGAPCRQGHACAGGALARALAPLPVQWQPVHSCHRWAGPSTQTHSFTSMSNLAPRLQTHQGKLEEAEPLYRETLRDYRSAWLPVLSEKQSGRPRRSRPCWRTRTQSTMRAARGTWCRQQQRGGSGEKREAVVPRGCALCSFSYAHALAREDQGALDEGVGCGVVGGVERARRGAGKAPPLPPAPPS